MDSDRSSQERQALVVTLTSWKVHRFANPFRALAVPTLNSLHRRPIQPRAPDSREGPGRADNSSHPRERSRGPFLSLADFYRRVVLTPDEIELMIRSAR